MATKATRMTVEERQEPRGERSTAKAPAIGPKAVRPRIDHALESPVARLAEVGASASRRIRRQPLTFLAVAIGGGFAIGGALSFRAGRFALSALGRHLVHRFIQGDATLKHSETFEQHGEHQ